jgi:hypothetical protein
VNPDPHQRISVILAQNTDNNWSEFLKIRSGINIPDPGSWLWIFFYPGSRIQGSKKHQIPDSGSGSATMQHMAFFGLEPGLDSLKILNHPKLVSRDRNSDPDLTIYRYLNANIKADPDPGPGPGFAIHWNETVTFLLDIFFKFQSFLFKIKVNLLWTGKKL